jgi:hypothetical protein
MVRVARVARMERRGVEKCILEMRGAVRWG